MDNNKIETILEEIKNRHLSATPGPWKVEGCGGMHMNGNSDYYRVYTLQRNIIHPLSKEDAEFIAYSYEDIPFLLNYIEKLKDQLGNKIPERGVENEAYKS